MIGIDSNVLVRYLCRDDPNQTALADQLIEQRLSLEEQGFISAIVIAETAWVLRRSYRWSTLQLADAMELLLAAGTLVVENSQAVAEAVTMVRQGRGDFTDALIGAAARKAGCSQVMTFDRGALRLPGFQHA